MRFFPIRPHRQPVYDVHYFIDKFENIPDEQWTTEAFFKHEENGEYTYCALGHCGATDQITTNESSALIALFGCSHFVACTNDGDLGYGVLGDTPRERILHILYHIRECDG